MNKRLLLAAVASVVAVGLVSGVTLARFTATKSASQDIKAGQLCFEANRDNSDPIPGPMFYVTPAQAVTGLGSRATGLWAPGDKFERTLIVTNPAACLDAWLDSVHANLASGDEELAGVLNVVITTANPGTGTDEQVASGTLARFLDDTKPPVELKFSSGDKVPLPAGSIVFLHFAVTLDKTANNDYQDKSLVVDFLVNGSQMAHNP